MRRMIPAEKRFFTAIIRNTEILIPVTFRGNVNPYNIECVLNILSDKHKNMFFYPTYKSEKLILFKSSCIEYNAVVTLELKLSPTKDDFNALIAFKRPPEKATYGGFVISSQRFKYEDKPFAVVQEWLESLLHSKEAGELIKSSSVFNINQVLSNIVYSHNEIGELLDRLQGHILSTASENKTFTYRNMLVNVLPRGSIHATCRLFEIHIEDVVTDKLVWAGVIQHKGAQ